MRYAQLGDLGEFKNGVNFKSEQMGRGVPLINVKDITGSHRIDSANLDLVEIETNDKMFAKEGDIFFVRSSVKLDGIALSAKLMSSDSKTIHCGFVIRFRPTVDELCTDYLLYLLRSHEYRERLKGLSGGAAIVNISQSVLKRLSIPLPSLPQQERIASILSAYDDRIENNRRRIQLLEQAARLLYREWFVYLRFPGHEHVTIADGVPEGWDKKHLSELLNTQYGFTETATDEPIGPKFLRGKDINKTSYIDWSTVPYCPEDRLDFRKYALHVDDIVVIRMADPGKVAIVESELKAIFASYLVRLTRKEKVSIPALYLFYVLSDDLYQGFISGASGGSTRKSASAKLLVDFDALIPPYSIASLFIDQIRPMRDQIRILVEQNTRSKAARDLLLPRLMNGEVAV